MKSLENKTAIVTGASRGPGKKIALQFALQGAKVVVNYASNQTAADTTVEEIKQKGGNAMALKADVSIAAEVNQLYSQTLKHFGGVDIVVNNAGIMITKPLKNFSETEFDQQFAINVKSVFLMMQVAAAQLNPNGRIINISSSTSRLMMPGYAIYSATKAAVEQMTRVFAKEIGYKGITVNSVLPGPMNTELFLQGKSEEMIQRIAGLAAFNRIGEVEDIVPIVLFLAGENAQWITGQNIGVNGGMV